ncbi:zinc-dependent alcohol dehydrogenase [Jannaschia rubra]|uniref:Putative L-galactonate oxidoreductase n=1 Tax=Jannaschia rubra TaxID=282197 RepID=A0A0M6XR90_9RHOB|nr:alcohol dehydrogenase catalytic domain-containing protein [Jannaschia rubra]CTQ32685.1 Putative L-galactonate oxidoreductase [Jannaschia rubra]SFF87427.1 Threonine dehydrogenase [Jannaschia rubra]
MKALIYDAPETLDFRSAPDPEPGPGEHLVRIHAAGICGSDMHAWMGHDARRPAPLILGHEAAGVIAGGPRDGERVTINPLVACGTCAACAAGRDNLCGARQIISMPPRQGAFAEWVAMPDANLIAVPGDVTLTRAALTEPLACGWHAVRLARQVVPDAARALVIGGGAIGVGSALALAAQGVGDVTVVEPNAGRRATLEAMGLRALAAPDDSLFDVVIDAVGLAASRATASACARPGGVIAHIGLGEDRGGLDVRRMTLQEIAFLGTYTYTAQDFRDTAQAIFDGRLGPLDWIDLRPLSEGAEAFRAIRMGDVPHPKVVLIPDGVT